MVHKQDIHSQNYGQTPTEKVIFVQINLRIFYSSNLLIYRKEAILDLLPLYSHAHCIHMSTPQYASLEYWLFQAVIFFRTAGIKPFVREMYIFQRKLHL